MKRSVRIASQCRPSWLKISAPDPADPGPHYTAPSRSGSPRGFAAPAPLPGCDPDRRPASGQPDRPPWTRRSGPGRAARSRDCARTAADRADLRRPARVDLPRLIEQGQRRQILSPASLDDGQVGGQLGQGQPFAVFLQDARRPMARRQRLVVAAQRRQRPHLADLRFRLIHDAVRPLGGRLLPGKSRPPRRRARRYAHARPAQSSARWPLPTVPGPGDRDPRSAKLYRSGGQQLEESACCRNGVTGLPGLSVPGRRRHRARRRALPTIASALRRPTPRATA